MRQTDQASAIDLSGGYFYNLTAFVEHLKGCLSGAELEF